MTADPPLWVVAAARGDTGGGDGHGEVAVKLLAGRYRLGEVLGQGASAVVHYGFDSTLKRPVAIKMFDETATGVLREARTVAGLSHPNIAQVYDYGEVVDGRERTPYLVMEFVDGETLADRLARTGGLRWRQAAQICADTASALAAAHAQDLVHRDVNPRNIMLTPDGVKVLDFGIAIAAGHNSVDTNGGLWGSPAHLAPEQLRGEPAFPAADVYALGLLMFECLTGSRAWPGGGIGEILANRHGRPAPRLPRVSGLPREVIRLYEACTADDPQDRPPASTVAETLRRVAGPAPLTRPAQPIPPVRPVVHAPASSAVTQPVPSRRRSRRRAMVMASAAVVTAFLSILGVQLANGTATPGGREAEAAVEGGHPETTSPHPTSPAPSTSPTTARTHRTTDTTIATVRKRTTAPGKRPAATPTSTPSSRPATPSATPSDPPKSSSPPVKPTPTQTPDDNPTHTDPPTEPTDPGTTSPPEETTPPVSHSPEAQSEDQPEV
jgi:serine/threonine protein kinase